MSPEQEMPLGEHDLGMLTSTSKVISEEVTSSFGEIGGLEPKIEKMDDEVEDPAIGHKPEGGGEFYEAFYDRNFSADRVRESQKCLEYGGEKIKDGTFLWYLFLLQLILIRVSLTNLW